MVSLHYTPPYRVNKDQAQSTKQVVSSMLCVQTLSVLVGVMASRYSIEGGGGHV